MALFFDSLTIPPAAALNAAGKGAEARQLSGAGSRSVVPVVYGQDRLGALVMNVLTNAPGGPTLLVQCLWAFACDGIDEVRLNDQVLPAGASITHYTGAQTVADAALASAFAAQGITYSQALTGYAYSVLSLPTRLFDGQLNITARVRGRRLYDPRKDSTAGGAGLHRLANPATWEWSDNPALALADFVASPVYGAATAVDWASLPAAAAACDATVGSPPERRRILGVALSGATEATDIAESLRAYAGCFVLPGAAGVRLLADANDTPVASYSHSAGDLAAIDSLSLRDLGAVPTAVEVLYTDTSKLPWRDGSATAQLPGAGTTRPWRLSQVRLPGVQRYSQALREATERLNKLALNELSTAIEVFDGGIRHDVGDIITVTHPLGLASAPMRVTNVGMPGPGRWRLSLVRHSAAAYSDQVATAPALADPTFLLPPGPPAAVAGLVGTVAQGTITWRWNPATERDWAETQLRTGGTDWASGATLWSGRATGYLQRVTTTGTYTLRARHVLTDGQLSATESVVSVTVLAGDLVQSEPGAPGTSQATVYLYQWGSASQPAGPSDTSSFNWANLEHSAYTGGNGWAVAPGSNPGTAGARLWVASKAIAAPAGTASSSVSWVGGYTVYAASVNGAAGPQGTAGGAGTPGIKAATPTVWRWAATIPTISGTATYTWSAADTGQVPTNWTSTPGTGSPGQTLWGASVQLVDAAGAATTQIDWSTASITARGYQGQDGQAGQNGAAGQPGQAGISARRAYVLTTASSLGGGTVTTSGINSLPGDGSFGANGWAANPATPVAGQVLYQSDGLFNPATNQVTWEAPYISALKVGQLSALAVNTGNLTVNGDLRMAGGQINSGAFNGYAWPGVGAGGGFHLGPSGLLLGNPTSGAGYVEMGAGGYISMPGLTFNNGVLTIGVSLNPDGTLNNGAGGQVTIGGLGYSGDLNATRGAPAGTPVAGTFPGGNSAATVETNVGTALNNASNALAGLNDKLNKSAADILSAPITLQTSGAIRAGDTTNGVVMAPTGLAGYKAGVVTFSINTSGDVLVRGTLATGTAERSGTTMTGNGFKVLPDGSGCWGTATVNITHDGAQLRINGPLITDANLALTGFGASITAGSLIYGQLGAPFTHTFSNVTVTPSGGVAPYSYQWTFSQTESNGAVSISMTGTITSNTVGFTAYVQSAGGSVSGLAICVITDANGRTTTKNVFVSASEYS